ncbi:type I restriction endonuclease subunit R [Stappia sp.]|uniref:type I restriction endonuclease subunit R n=1 Tax=Stappia sp. TaxID=1870903 RepID=UPI003C7A0C36
MKNHSLPNANEETQAKIPALALLMKLGWSYVSREACLAQRGSERAVLMEGVLREWLAAHRFSYRGRDHPLSPGGIQQVLKAVNDTGLNEGLMAANEKLYKLLVFGVTVSEFMEDGKKHAVTVPLLDFTAPARNRLQVTEELTVERETGIATYRPDIVLYVNGIPLVVIEAKRPAGTSAKKGMVAEGISHNLRNQKPDGIPLLYAYSQLLLAISGDQGRYATTGTAAKFWAIWREEETPEADIEALVNAPLSADDRTTLFASRPKHVRDYFERLWSRPILPTGQDTLIASLLTPERLLEFVRYFLMFDQKAGKIAARYQQVFGVKAMLRQLEKRNSDGGREGGVIWHTTGSGKSYTMVFLLKALLLRPGLENCRTIMVTDRTDLERQLARTFLSGGAFGSAVATKKDGENAKAQSGRDLARRIGSGTERILFTLLQKFTSAASYPECHNASSDIIVLVDEGHRSQGGESHERMRLALPNAAFIAFTGTPLLNKDKKAVNRDGRTETRFGPILHAYTMQRAVEDQTVTPLLYEERKPDLDINEKAVDAWFEKRTTGLSEQQQADLKRKFSTRGAIYGADQRIALIALDIADHFSTHWKDLGLKAQLATDSKLWAIRYKAALDADGRVSSAVVISPPDTREGHEDTSPANTPEVQKWWKGNVGNDAEAYEKAVLESFGGDGDPDILIVVDKLLTGFDEPRNTVLYIDKYLRDHNLLQAIARVNRLHEAKKYGYLVDYRGILKELDTSLKEYQDLAERTQGGYEIDDLVGLYANVSTEYKQLPGLHKALWAIFKDVKNRQDMEQFRRILVPRVEIDEAGDSFDRNQQVRDDFYAALSAFGMCLKLALSSRSFFEDSAFGEAKIAIYKRDLKHFTDLRVWAKRASHETVDFSTYEKQIRDLIDKQVIGVEIKEPQGYVDITGFGEDDQASYMALGDPDTWDDEKARTEADIIRSRVARTIEQELGDDPYAQKAFSVLLRQAIAEADNLFDHPHKQFVLFKDLEEQVRQGKAPGIPGSIAANRHQRAYYGAFLEVLPDETTKDLGEAHFIEEAKHVDAVVQTAVAAHSLDPQNAVDAITKQLLPRFFNSYGGLETGNQLIDQIIEIVRRGASRGD